jgi:predicted ATP-dependent endonuclease of OLD family
LYRRARNESTFEFPKENHNQFFLTTHSSIFTDVESDVATYLISKTKTGSITTPIEVKSDLKLIKEQLGIRNSDMYGDDYVIFVEGDPEDVSFESFFKPFVTRSYERKLDSLI